MPRKKFRTARCKTKAKLVVPAAPKAALTCKRKQWSEESMTAALNEFRNGLYPINKTAVWHGVPNSTLHDCISDRARHSTKPGPIPYLDPIKEQEFADQLITVAKNGYEKTRKEVKMIAENVSKEKKYHRQLEFLMDDGKAFYSETKVCLFVMQIPLHTSEWIVFTKNQYFNLLEQTIILYNIQKSPNQIYKTGMPLSSCIPNTVTQNGQKKMRCRTSDKLLK